MDVDDGRRRIGLDPFAVEAPVDLVRRLRGRLVAPVTVWTACGPEGRAVGVTVSSMMVAEGDPALVMGLVGPLTEFWEAAQETKRFIVHVLDADATRWADQFAGRYPGDPFEGVALTLTAWGPSIDRATVRARCSLSGFLDAGYQVLVRAVLDAVEIPADGSPPLVHYRGRYLTTAPRR